MKPFLTQPASPPDREGLAAYVFPLVRALWSFEAFTNASLPFRLVTGTLGSGIALVKFNPPVRRKHP